MSSSVKSVAGRRVVGLPDGLRPRFFSGLTIAELEAILSAATPRRFPESSVIVHQDDPAERLFLLTSGQGRQFVTTSGGRKIIVHWLTAGQFFGGATLVSTPWQYLASTEVQANSSTLVWDRKTVREFVSRIPRLLDNALSIAVTEHMAWSVASRVSLASDDAAGRIANLLVSLACGIGKIVPTRKSGANCVEIRVGNEDLAAGANVTTFTVSRTLSGWERDGILTKGRGKVLLLRPELLISG